MRHALKIKPNHVTVLAAVLVASATAPGAGRDGTAVTAPAMISLQPHPFYYRPAGEFTHDGKPVNAPARLLRPAKVLTIMAHQVTGADYQRCVLDHACTATSSGAEDRPAIKINWHDANAYAAWLSRRLGATYRLPTDEEWAFAAGSRFRDDALPDGAIDLAQRWLQRYEVEADRDEVIDNEPHAIGSYGANEYGVLDLAGNVWEWTNTCFVHQTLNATRPTSILNCGIRVVEGRHRAYMTDFIRDPSGGGCAVGKPPSNLGFRLVRENGLWDWLQSIIAPELSVIRTEGDSS